MKFIKQCSIAQLENDVFRAKGVLFANDLPKVLWCEQPDAGKDFTITYDSETGITTAKESKKPNIVLYYEDGTVDEFSDATEMSWDLIKGKTESWSQNDTLIRFELNDGVTKINSYAFNNCTNIQTYFISNSVKTIGSYAFEYSKLPIINIPNGVEDIQTCAFKSCTTEKIIVPNSVVSIAYNAFAYMYGVKYLEWTPNADIFNYSIFGYGLQNTIEYVHIGGGVKTIDRVNDSNVLYSSKNLNTVILDEGIETINASFQYCKNLTSLQLPSTIINIGNQTFYYGNLKSINIPKNVTNIGYSAFYYCTSLEDITYDNTISNWHAITKGTYWKYNVPSTCIVHCTDGDIPIAEA